jgi:hypothetical protein
LAILPENPGEVNHCQLGCERQSKNAKKRLQI